MASKTLSGTYSVGYDLTVATLLNEGTIDGPLPIQSVGLYSQNLATITNSGVIVLANPHSAVSLHQGGVLTNLSGGTIGGYAGIVISGGAGTVINASSIIATGTATLTEGVYLQAGGQIYNAATASITGGYSGVVISGGPGTVSNAGVITGTNYNGLYLLAGGSVTNTASASIKGGSSGVVISAGGAGTVVNAGFVGGTKYDGVVLEDGGYVSNSASGVIIGYGDEGVFLSAGGTLTNAGTIDGNNGGIDALLGGSVTNDATAAIFATRYGVFIRHGLGSVVNAGLIAGSGYDGIRLYDGGSVTNETKATITGATNGVVITDVAGTLVNAGYIIGSSSDGVALTTGGSVTNQASGTIIGQGDEGVFLSAGGSVTNRGTITGYNGGVDVLHGGSVTNAASAAIIGTRYGIFMRYGTGSVVNTGLIAGTGNDGVKLYAGGAITNEAVASIAGGSNGIVIAGGAGTVINAGTIVGGTGTAISFYAVSGNLLKVEPGAVFSGLVAAGTSANSSLELASAASVGTLSDIGTQFIDFGSIQFDAGADWFISGDATGLSGTISGFAPGDTIEVTGITVIGSHYVGGKLVLMEASGSVDLNLPGSFATSDFLVSNVAAGADVSLVAPCFVAGTRIGTERGAVAVEALHIGDRVPVVIGRKPQPIVWLGHRHVDCRSHPEPKDVWPVCLSAGAFGPGRPFRDLWLSPDHALFIDGALVPIRYLINNRTIRQEKCDEVTYWHVELAEHNVLYAEGVPAESYLDTGNRAAFANGGAVVEMHPDFGSIVWESQGCAPLMLNGRRLAEAKRRLLARANAIGRTTTDDPGLSVLADGKKLSVAMDGRIWRVTLPKKARYVRLVSRIWAPAHVQPASNDLRPLGVAISRLWLDRRQFELESSMLVSGWHAREQEWRWTNGDASLDVNGARELAFEVTMTGAYWVDGGCTDVCAA